MNKKYTLVRGDYWEGLYIDGKLVTEGHEISLAEFAQLLGLDFERKCANLNWLETRGSLPDSLKKVKFEKE